MDKQVKKIIRVALLVLALANVVLDMFGLSPIDLDSETITNFFNSGAVIVLALWNTWKNCSVSQAHLKADEIAEHIKHGAEIVIQYQNGGEFDDGTEEEHEVNDPDDDFDDEDDVTIYNRGC